MVGVSFGGSHWAGSGLDCIGSGWFGECSPTQYIPIQPNINTAVSFHLCAECTGVFRYACYKKIDCVCRPYPRRLRPQRLGRFHSTGHVPCMESISRNSFPEITPCPPGGETRCGEPTFRRIEERWWEVPFICSERGQGVGAGWEGPRFTPFFKTRGRRKRMSTQRKVQN